MIARRGATVDDDDEDEEDEDQPAPRRGVKTAKKPLIARRGATVDDDDEDEEDEDQPAPRRGVKTAKKPLIARRGATVDDDDEDEEDEDQPAPRRGVKTAKKPLIARRGATVDDDDEDEEDEDQPAPRRGVKTAKKPLIARRGATVDDDDEDEEDEDQPAPRRGVKTAKKPLIARRGATVDDDDEDEEDEDQPAPRRGVKTAKKPLIARRGATVDEDEEDEDQPAPRRGVKTAKKPLIARRGATVDDDDEDEEDEDQPAPRRGVKTAKKSLIARRGATVDDDDEDEEDEDQPAPRRGVKTAKKPLIAGRGATRDDDGFASFLRKHGLGGDEVRDILSAANVNSLSDLKMTKEVPDLFAELKTKFRGRPIVIKTLDRMPVEAIDNAIFFSKNPEREAEAQALADFLIEHDVLAEGEESDKEVLLRLLRPGVTSLSTLKSIKASGENDQKLKALTAKISKWSQEAGSSFESITVAMVVKASLGQATEASDELKHFLRTKGLPAGTEAELVEFGVITLEDLKAVKEDDTRLKQLKAKLDNAGIPGATEKIGRVKVADIEQEIAEANAPEAKEARQKSAELARAIKEVQVLRQKVEKAAGTEFSAVKSEVVDLYADLLKTIGDVSGADFKSAAAAAATEKSELAKLLSATIRDATAVEEIMDGVKKAPRPLASIINRQGMLCGFLINPKGVSQAPSHLVKLPENPERMIMDPGEYKDSTHRYKGSAAKSFAASTAHQASRTLAAAAEGSAAFFAGSGVGAVSAAAKYGDSQIESDDKKNFAGATSAECGEIRYIYAPKQGVQFFKDELYLSDPAKAALGKIVNLPADQQADGISDFYNEFGSHFFLQYTLGGRYQFTAEGTSSSETAKGTLITAVARTADWAAAASGSYAGIGGAVQAAASVQGQTSVGSAQADRFALNFDNAQVTVTTAALGGAMPAPRDVWAASLRYNSTWAIIDRKQPIAVWDIMRRDGSLGDNLKRLIPAFESTWVRQVFLNAVQTVHPDLHKYLKASTTITTAKRLEKAVDELYVIPECNVVVVTKTSEKNDHPVASTTPPREGLKLIGGGAIVEPSASGQPGNLLLTASYPDPAANSWIAKAKSHKWSSPGTVKAYALYLDDKEDNWEVKSVSAPTDGKTHNPQVTALLPPGYALTGGGAAVTWDGQGLMLKECCPVKIQGEYRGWTAKGTDHLDSDVGQATAWVIGIRPRNGAAIPPTNVYSVDMKTDKEVHPLGVHWSRILLGTESTDEVIVGGGAATGYDPPPVGLLTGSGLTPDNQQWCAQAKTHVAPDTKQIEERQYVELTIWVICRKGRLVP